MDATTAAPYVAGDQVTWHRESRGGYGFISHIPAVIERVTFKRLRVLVGTARGEFVSRTVRPEHVSRRSLSDAVDGEFSARCIRRGERDA